MISFVGKIVEVKRPYIIVKVVYINGVFYAEHNKKQYPINNWNVLYDCPYIYALPTNTYWHPWYKKKTGSKNFPNHEIACRFWGKFYDGMQVKGEIINDVFYEQNDNRNTKKS